jgi:hypothetical protein
MAEAKVVELVAIDRAFFQGALVERGDTVMFTGSKLPTWAKPRAEAVAELAKSQRVAGDLKPKAAQTAVRKKSADLAGG